MLSGWLTDECSRDSPAAGLILPRSSVRWACICIFRCHRYFSFVVFGLSTFSMLYTPPPSVPTIELSGKGLCELIRALSSHLQSSKQIGYRNLINLGIFLVL